MPASSLSFLHKDPHLRTPCREDLRPILEVHLLLLSMNKVVGDLNGFLDKMIKELNNYSLDMKDHQQQKWKEQDDLKKRIQEAKIKMMTIVERFFTDFEKEVAKSIICFNESMKENYSKVEEHIGELKKEIQEKSTNLGTDKVLKTLIGFHAKDEEAKYL